jgi:hypothetical protein
MKIGFRTRPSFRHGHRWSRSSFADPPNYVLGATYVVAVAIVFVTTWLTLDHIFGGPAPSGKRGQLASVAEDDRGVAPAFVEPMVPEPHFNEPIALVQAEETGPLAPESVAAAAIDPPEPANRPEEEVKPRPADASGTSEPPPSTAPAPAQKPAAPKKSGASGASGHLRLQLAAVKSAPAGERAWNDIKQHQADLLGGVEASVLPADLPELGRVYRVRTAPLLANEAKRKCDELRRRQVPCHLVR